MNDKEFMDMTDRLNMLSDQTIIDAESWKELLDLAWELQSMLCERYIKEEYDGHPH